MSARRGRTEGRGAGPENNPIGWRELMHERDEIRIEILGVRAARLRQGC